MNLTTRILIELHHLDLGEIACGRCSDTGETLLNVIAELGGEHLLDDAVLEVKNTLLLTNRANESNMVINNGIPLEQILDEKVGCAQCSACSEFCGQQDRDIVTAIPEEKLRKAIKKGSETVNCGIITRFQIFL